ncbi:MAG: hypothetical protein FGM58_11505 [Acidimicrobiia bacterium]|nr:hypothetical protein [Acidimicrobiia bacterium]
MSRRASSGRRSLSIATLLGLFVGVVMVPPPARTPAAAATLTVDYGINGPEALAESAGFPLVPVAMVPASTETTILLGFRSPRADLEARALAVSDPASPLYGAYAPVAVNAAIYNATDEQVQSAVDWFAARGETVVPDATRTFIEATVTVALLEELTGATFGAFVPEGFPSPPPVVVVSPTTELSTITPALAASIDRVAGVVFPVDLTSSALSVETRRPRPAASVPDPASTWTLTAADGGTPWRTGTPIDACPDALETTDFGHPMGISPAQLREAFGVDELWAQGFRGRGARIAVVDYAPYLASDIDVWRSCFGLGGTPVTDHVTGPLISDWFQSLETTLDLQAVLSIAPEAERIDWFGVSTDAPTMVGSLIELLAPAFDASLTGGVAPDVVTVSFAVCELEIVNQDPAWRVGSSLFDQMVATGVAAGIGTFVATGDRGSSGCFPTTDDVNVSFPASSRWVTAVGGTNLTLDARNRIVSAGVWNDARFASPPQPVSSPFDSGGGGVSVMSAASPWQSGVAPGTARTVPDVSHFADLMPGAFLHYLGGWMPVGGTSLASPLLAASFALQSAARAARGEPRLGFVSPLLYSLAADESMTDVVIDVVLGDNDPHGVGVYVATSGYDLASGLGWVRQDRLLAALDRPDPVPVDPVGPVFTG